MSDSVKPEILPVKVIAAKLSRSVRTILRMAESGQFPRLVRIGGQNFVVASEFERWFADQLAARE